MRILLDKNVPKILTTWLADHQTVHVRQLGLTGVRNGSLLALAREEFDLFLTFDQSIAKQHNHAGQKLRILTLRLRNNREETVAPHWDEILARIENLEDGEVAEYWPKS